MSRQPVSFRSYCRSKGLKGKHKKRLRRELRDRVKQRTSAKVASANSHEVENA